MNILSFKINFIWMKFPDWVITTPLFPEKSTLFPMCVIMWHLSFCVCVINIMSSTFMYAISNYKHSPFILRMASHHAYTHNIYVYILYVCIYVCMHTSHTHLFQANYHVMNTGPVTLLLQTEYLKQGSRIYFGSQFERKQFHHGDNSMVRGAALGCGSNPPLWQQKHERASYIRLTKRKQECPAHLLCLLQNM